MINQDFHIHTNYCDGKNTPEEMVCRAVELNMQKIGLVCHSYTDFDDSYCINKDKISDFIAKVHSLAEKYKDKIEVFCGVEQDYYSTQATDGFDYVLGSVHYVKVGDKYLDVDNTKEQFALQVREYFDGDYIAFCEEYFKTVANVVQKTNCDIIGHFDLCTKFNEGNALFDTNNPRYTAAAYAAIDTLLEYGKPFEINTGAISRGYRNQAYPEEKFIKYIMQNGGNLVLSSDSHSADFLCCDFDKYEKYVNHNPLKNMKIVGKKY